MKLNEYQHRFSTILKLNSTPADKDKMLSGLMTEMEQAFQIPMIKNKAWAEENSEVYTLYRKVAESRSL